MLTLISIVLRSFLLPIIIVVGSFLNILSFLVMRRIKSNTSFYMSVLGLVDTGTE
jgi:hypothetical protein